MKNYHLEMREKRYEISTFLNFWVETDIKPTKEAMKKHQNAVWLWFTGGEPLPKGIIVDLVKTTLWDDKVADEDNPIEEV